MARWRLTIAKAYYLNVVGTEWEYEETIATGMGIKSRMPVPLFLDPDERDYQNRDGDVVVSYVVGAQEG